MSELSRPVRWVLLLSLLLNAALLGGLIGHQLGIGRSGPPDVAPGADGRRTHSPGRLARLLPAERRPLLRELFEAHRPQMRAQAQQIHRARREVAALLRAEPLDRAALEATLAELREAEGAAAAGAHAMLLDLAERLPAAERQDLAERLDRPRRRGRGDRPTEPPR